MPLGVDFVLNFISITLQNLILIVWQKGVSLRVRYIVIVRFFIFGAHSNSKVFMTCLTQRWLGSYIQCLPINLVNIFAAVYPLRAWYFALWSWHPPLPASGAGLLLRNRLLFNVPTVVALRTCLKLTVKVILSDWVRLNWDDYPRLSRFDTDLDAPFIRDLRKCHTEQHRDNHLDYHDSFPSLSLFFCFTLRYKVIPHGWL